MAKSGAYVTFERTVAAGKEDVINATGVYVACLASNLSDFRIGLDDDADDYFAAGLQTRQPGEEVFSKVRIKNTYGTPLTVRLALGLGLFKDSRLTLSGTLKTSVSKNIASGADVSIGVAASALVAAANSGRREVIISNLAANTETLRIGDAGAAAAEGVELPPGASIILATEAAVYAYNPGAAAQSVGVLEVID